MSARVPKAWETTWAQEAIKEEVEKPAARFDYLGHSVEPSGEIVFLVDREGRCRAVDGSLSQTEHWRVTQTKALAAVPVECSAEIITAPARGPIAPFREVYWHETAHGNEWRHVPYRSGCPGRTRDIFDIMTDQATRRGGVAPFDIGQVFAGREYRALHERVQSAGLKCSSAFDDKVRGKGKVDFMDSYLADAQRLSWFHEAIGGAIAKDMKRVSPEKAQRVIITDDILAQADKRIITVRTLVDDVCIKEKALSDVLGAHGWSVTGKNRKALRDALCAALGRMQGI